MATTEQFSLRWNNFHSNLTNGFHELLEAAEMVDVTLAVDGHFLQAHKVVLSICSPYFKQMFRENPCKHPIVILRDVGHEHMKDILEFMYIGEVSVLRENLSTFLKIAEVLQVKGLTGDDTSETSSGKDEKLEIEEDPEIMYNEMLETEVDYPPHYPNPQESSPPNSTPNKRKIPSQNHQKRSKTNKVQNDLTSPVKDEQPDFDNGPMKLTDLETEPKSWENNLATSGSAESILVDQDGLLYANEMKTHVFCPYCYRKFVNRYNMRVHIRDKHEENATTDLDCRVCGKTMRNQSCLRVHMYHHRKQQMEATI